MRKMGTGFFLLALSFVIPWRVEVAIAYGGRPSIWWQIIAYVLLPAYCPW